MLRELQGLSRIAILGLVAAVGYVAVYVPLMYLLFDKRVPLIFFVIVLMAVTAAFKAAQFADRRLLRV
jgi:hypothetical protein